MKVTIIYDSMESHPIRIVTYTDRYGFDTVQYFGEQRYGKTNHWLRGFDSLEDVYKWATNNDEYCRNSTPEDFELKKAFASEKDFCMWINHMCDDASDLEEVYTTQYFIRA